MVITVINHKKGAPSIGAPFNLINRPIWRSIGYGGALPRQVDGKVLHRQMPLLASKSKVASADARQQDPRRRHSAAYGWSRGAVGAPV
jgi:hypothetical protein